MSDNSQAVAATVLGAVVGALAGYLFFTDRGRELRRQLEPALDNLTRELNSSRTTLHKVVGVASEGWRLMNEAMGESTPLPSRYPSPHQTTPF